MEEIKNRFEKFLKGYKIRIVDDFVHTDPEEMVKSFLQSEIDLAVSKERERAIDKIKHHFNGYGGSLGFTKNELINLINTK